MAYRGYRPILPGQNTNEWRHVVTGEKAVYSNWQLMSETQALEDMPLEHHEPGTGRHPHGILSSQMFTGEQRYAPMELSKYSHGGQRAAYLRFDHLEHHGVPAGDMFAGDWGHDGTREFNFSRFQNWGQLAVPSADKTLDGHAIRYYGDEGVASGFGRYRPYENQGVGEDIMADPGQDYEEGRYGFEKVNEYFGVPSAKAL